MTASRPATAAAARMAMLSSSRRLPRSTGFSAEIPAATSSGITVASGSNWSTGAAVSP